MNANFPAKGRIAGIDYGTVRIGVAISDPGRTLSSPHDNYTRVSEAADRRYFQQLADDEQIVGFVVGLPIHLSGDESPKSREARDFAGWLSEATGRPVQFHDERFTSVEAEQILGGARLTAKQRKRRRDMLAAQIILASFLETEGNGSRQENQRPES